MSECEGVCVVVGGALVYLIPAILNYYFIFDHELLKHPKILRDKNGVPNQIEREIKCALGSVPGMALPTAAIFVFEVRGHGYLYDSVDERGYLFFFASVFMFILFTDFVIYWVHRYLHHPWFYAPLHKTHHLWKIPTPFASHAFHPIDGFVQSAAYHIYPFIFPLHKGLYLFLFVFVNLWSTSIHDGDYRVPDFLKPIINGCAHHSDHHLYFNYNYGEYLTVWDRVFGSFMEPSAYKHKGIHDDIANMKKGAKVFDDVYEGVGPDPLKTGVPAALIERDVASAAKTAAKTASSTNGSDKAAAAAAKPTTPTTSPRAKAKKLD